MNELGLRFHHLGLAVRRPRDATRFLAGLAYEIPEPIFDPEQNVHLIMCRHSGPMPDVEIIYPADSRSPADAWIKLHPDGLVYHMCFVADDIAAALRPQLEVKAGGAAPNIAAVRASGSGQ